EVVSVGVAGGGDDVAVIEQGEPIVDDAVHGTPLCVLVTVEHLDGVEVKRESGSLGMVIARVEAAEVEVADLVVEARVVDINDRFGRAFTNVLKEVTGGAPVNVHRAMPGVIEVARQRKRSEMTPVGGGQLVAGETGEVATDAQLCDDGTIVRDHVVVGGDDEL